MMNGFRGYLTFAIAVLTAFGGSGWAASAPIGAKVYDFQLPDVHGRLHKLSDFADSKALVLVFLGTECPLANTYAPHLDKLAKSYADKGVAFVAVNSNIQDTLAKISAYIRRHEFTLPMLKDNDGRLADQVGAVRTPEVVVLDASRAIRYRGRIDDQFGVGYQQKAPTHTYLVDALEQILAGEPVAAPEVAAVGCFIGRTPKTDPTGDVTYSNQIARIFNRRCVECHRTGELAPFPMTSYEEVLGWTDTIREVVQEERMPPWFANPEYGEFKNDCRLSPEEKQLVFTWIDNGAPEGDPKDLPEPPQFASGWLIPEPDEVFYIAEKPVAIPAEGVVDYQYYTVDPGWKEDKWIQASECRPGNRGVVHHIIAFIERPGGSVLGMNRTGLGGYAPGMPPTHLEPGTAMFVPAGSKIVFQMHYTPNGREQEDLSCVGVKYADPSTVKYVAHGGLAANFMFRIPPHADNHKVSSSYTFKRDTTLRSLTPHMHLRGKSFRFELEYPDGRREILLDVPKYDFNWQLRYELAKPKPVPKGAKLLCTAHFDNSANNPANPDPNATVRWGDQTWEEMMIGWFSTVEERKFEKAGNDEQAAASPKGDGDA
jgi:peroxiredoxin